MKALLLTTLALTLSLATSPTHAADEKQIPRTISVSGEGTASAPPDLANISTGVTTSAATAGAALAANTKAMTAVLSTLKDQGIADRDIQTSNFNVQPQYQSPPRGSNQPPKIIGYQVSNNLRVRVRDLDKLGALLDILVESGSNRISGISFTIDKPEALLVDARRQAVINARERAEIYAGAAGVKVGEVLTISEQSSQIPRPQYMERSMKAMAMSDSPVPVASGEQTIRTTVHMVFAIQ